MKNKKHFRGSSCILAVDAGGTNFKSALVSAEGKLISESFRTFAVDSRGSRDSIISTYNEITKGAMEYADAAHYKVAGMSVATPGPFDIFKGYSLMTHKFQSLYKLDLAKTIREESGFPDTFSIRFVSDAHAFIMGENWQGNARGFQKVVGVTLGTGLGFGCSIDQALLTNDIGGPRFNLFDIKYGNGVLEDRVSRRGIVNAYKKRAKGAESIEIDVKEIAERARSGKDEAANFVFHETGLILLDYLEPICNTLKIECILLGGQISKAFELIRPGFRNIHERIPTLQRVDRAAHIDHSALLGAASLFFETASVQS